MRRIALFAVLVTALGPSIAYAGEAGVIVRTDEGTEQTCVSFDEAEITGAELLERSGSEVVEEQGSLGTAICSIDGAGCGRDDCFCNYPTFWGYWTKDGDTEEWRFSDVGAAERVVRNGSLDGWSFGKDGKPAPADVTFDDVCSASGARPTGGGDTEVLVGAPNYVPFAAFIAVFAAAGLFVYRIRRRRTRPSDT